MFCRQHCSMLSTIFSSALLHLVEAQQYGLILLTTIYNMGIKTLFNPVILLAM